MRVLLVRLDGVGDAAVCAPLLAGLREAGHDVGAALTTRNAGLFAPGVLTAEHVLERIPWPAHGSTPASSARAAAEIAERGYDVALIATEEPEGVALARTVPRRIGFVTGWERPLKTLWMRARVQRVVRRSQRIGAQPLHEAEVLWRLGAGLVAAAEPPRAAQRLRALFGVPPVRSGGGPLVVQAGAKWRASGVADDVLRAALAALAPDGLRIVCAPGEAAAVRAQTGAEPDTFASLAAWVAVLDGARAVLTVDTGAAHVAGMLGTPVVDVFPEPHFAAQVRRWRPWASPYRALRAGALGGAGEALVEAVRHGF